jgi:uncharacterized protein with HEPN domain
MAKKIDKIYLEHILDSIVAIEKYLKKFDRKLFVGTPYLVDAVVRRFEIIGEASKRLPEDFKGKHKEIPWRDIADTRNFMIHQYFDVDADEVWKYIKNDLPDLKKNIKKLL